MATKRFCDHCGAEIKLLSHITYAGIRNTKTGLNYADYELCVSCARELKLWLNGKKGA